MTPFKIIYGIQQVGIGVRDADAAFEWYAKVLGADMLVFDDRKMATHMAKYMGGEAHQKRALLAMHPNGGSGYEIWQYQDREPQGLTDSLRPGDLGVNFITLKTYDIAASYAHLQRHQTEILTRPASTPDGEQSFFFKDPYGNLIQLKGGNNSWFTQRYGPLGGIQGVGIGVSDIDQAKALYADILGYSLVVCDEIVPLAGYTDRVRRVLLRMPAYPQGGFSELLGSSEIELLQCLDRTPNRIFADRYWGDLGYIHVCFDTKNIHTLIAECERKGFPFQVKSEATFEMGDTNGRWGYLEDADGSLVEFVEAQRVPLVKRFNWRIDLRQRDPHQPLSRWLLRAMRLKRVKF
ncbi:MAG: glyoxalase [Bacteroidetes bacterium]|nr:MAG: glyoxalase [Bacteroidota bacterium]PTM09553.1 MAG: glyoxalase [Bacteroidota bacterium]